MKRELDMHTNIATALLDQIKVKHHLRSQTSTKSDNRTIIFNFFEKRKLDIYFETEEKLITKATLVSDWSILVSTDIRFHY